MQLGELWHVIYLVPKISKAKLYSFRVVVGYTKALCVCLAEIA